MTLRNRSHDDLVLLAGAPDSGRDAQMWVTGKEFLGPEANIKVEYVDAIATVPCGKRRLVTNLWRGASS